jgi:hypothetical protein
MNTSSTSSPQARRSRFDCGFRFLRTITAPRRLPKAAANWVIANSRLAKALRDKGYAYQFVYSKGAGHTQRKVIDNTLPQALEYVWLDYRPQR